MAVSSKIEILLYCLLESLDVLTRPTGHALGTVHGMHGLSPSLQERSAYLVRRGLVDSDINAQMRRIYRLTRSGAICALGGIDPEERWERGWDGLWRLVIYDIPEVDRRLRSKLRRELSNNGFGFLQKSVWISPHPVDELKGKLKKLKIDTSMIVVMEARADTYDRPENIVIRAWNFERIRELYDDHRELFRRTPTAKSTKVYAREWALHERSLWNEILKADPFLPDCLLPKHYGGKKAWRSRLRVLRRVAPLVREAILEDPSEF